MLLVVDSELDAQKERELFDSLDKLGVQGQLVRTEVETTVVITTDVRALPTHVFSNIPSVRKVVRLSATHPLVDGHKVESRDSKDKKFRVARGRRTGTPDTAEIGAVCIGSASQPVVAAGPCSVESFEQIIEIAHAVKAAGATLLRGGAFKPRTSPYEFCGLGLEGMRYLAEAGDQTGLPVVSEVMSPEQVEKALPFIDILQIGARNMYNYDLLREVGRADKPVLLKRGMSATIDEFLSAAEYILLEGNERVILCERGIRTFESKTRNTLDLSAVPILKAATSLPVVVDPSHATGKRNLIRPLSRAAIACGADGLLIEVHSQPDKSISDAEQAITPEELSNIVKDTRAIRNSLDQIQLDEIKTDSPVSKILSMANAPGRDAY